MSLSVAVQLVVWSALLHGAWAEADGAEECDVTLLQTNVEHTNSVQSHGPYYWVKRGGATTGSIGYTPYSAVSDFSRGPAWVWNYSNDEQVRHSPLIDHKKNIYVTTKQHLYKFNADGELLWTWQTPNGILTASPALYKGNVFLLSYHPRWEEVYVNALDMDRGHLVWTQTLVPAWLGSDSQSVTVEDGIVIFAKKSSEEGVGNDMWHAMKSSDGSQLWEYAMGEVVSNALPSTPGDGTLLYASSCGGAARINLKGKKLWRSGQPLESNTCSRGGGSLGPNGVFYTEYTTHQGHAHVSAYQVSDGKLLWERKFPHYGGGQYPAVGKLGKDGPLAVVVAIGDTPGTLPFQFTREPKLHRKYMNDAGYRKQIGVKDQKNAVVALDAANGKVIWRWEEKAWDHVAAQGDEDERMLRRLWTRAPGNAECMPDNQGIPLIAGDGTVYASSGHAGDLTAIHGDADGNGVISQTEVSSFVTHQAFVNSPSLAPGMLVAAPCWGPMYVFKIQKD